MGSRIAVAVVISLGLMAVQPALAMAEHEHGGQSQTHEEAAGTQTTGDATKHSCMQCQESAKALDEVLAKIDEAKQSNDPARVRALLDEVQKPLANMKQHMSMCQMTMGKAEGMCPMCKVTLDKDGRCPQCGMKM